MRYEKIITLCQNTAGHFEAISEGTVKSTDFSKNGYYLKDHLLLFENIKPWADQCRNADIVIFQEYGGGFAPVGENSELQELNETYHIGGSAFCRGENIMGRFIELFGDGTDYYSYSCNLSSGLLKPENIPGDTEAEKASFMERVKAEIQILLDLQK